MLWPRDSSHSSECFIAIVSCAATPAYVIPPSRFILISRIILLLGHLKYLIKVTISKILEEISHSKFIKINGAEGARKYLLMEQKFLFPDILLVDRESIPYWREVPANSHIRKNNPHLIRTKMQKLTST